MTKLPDSGFSEVLKQELAKRTSTKEVAHTTDQIDPQTLTAHTKRGTMTWEQGWRYVAGLMSGDIR